MNLCRSLTASLVLLFAAACSSPPLTSRILEASDEECPTGGKQISFGPDKDGDGELEDGEVTQTVAVCNGETGATGNTGEQGVPGTNALIRTSVEDSGANCATGGTRIDVGTDDNDNGTLEDGEIDQTAFTCNGATGADGLNVLVNTVAEPAGANCAEGGLALSMGLDDNRDGTLDAGEVDDTSYVCNGAEGVQTLIDVTAEAAGANCAAGGQKLTTGSDDDGNGTLDASEVQDTEYVCNPIRNLVLVTQEPAGANCATAGQRITSGLDSDNDGVLASAEVVETAYVCNGAVGASGAQSLVKLTAETAGTNCTSGGTRVASGVDSDDNGVLSAAEELSISFVCNGTNGTNGLGGGAVNVTPEPAGANCINGGTRIQTGPDSNGNQALDPSEVTSTTYACNGAAVTSRVEVVPEAAGPNCANGGQKYTSGPDLNGNGVLDAGEINQTAYVCNGIANVPFAIQTATLAAPKVSSPYSAVIEAIGGTGGGYQWTVSAGALPPGLSLGATGTPSTTLGGVPTTAGTYTFTIAVQDYFGQITSRPYTVEVEEGLRVTSYVLPRLKQNVAYTANLTAAGGTGPYGWAVVIGALPAGLTLNATTGAISGTPSSRMGSSFIVELTDSVGTKVRARVTIGGEAKKAVFWGDIAVDGTQQVYVTDVSGTSPGAPVQVSTNTTGANGAILGTPEFSPDYRWLVYRADFDTDAVTELYAVDVSGATPGAQVKLNSTLPTSADVIEFKWSPDGEWLGYRADQDTNDTDELYLVNMSGATPAAPVKVNGALVSGGDVYGNWAFSPDGSQIAYVADQDTDIWYELYLADVSAAPTATKIVTVGGTSFDVETSSGNLLWSPDSAKVYVLGDLTTDAVYELYEVNVSTAAMQKVSGTMVTSADVSTSGFSLSPNGKRLAYESDQEFNDSTSVYVVDVSGATPSTPVRVSHPPTNTALDVFEAVWSPDSQRILFRGDMEFDLINELYVVDATSTNPSPLKLNATLPASADVESNYQWTPDGRAVIFRADADVNDTIELWRVRISSAGNPERLNQAGFASTSDVASFTISPDGTDIAFVADPVAGDVDTLYLVDISTVTAGAPVQVNATMASTADVTSSSVTFTPDGSGLLYRSDERVDTIIDLWFSDLTGATPGTPVGITTGVTGAIVSGHVHEP